jgi:hypothetical protein
MSNHALDANGALKDASEIKWFNNADDDVPLPPPNLPLLSLALAK